MVSACGDEHDNKGNVTNHSSPEESRVRKAPEGIIWEGDTAEQVPFELFEAFNRFWTARAAFDWHTVYGFEAPHIKWKFNEIKFTRMHALASEVHEVKVHRVDVKQDDVIVLHLSTVLTSVRDNETREFWPSDTWIRMNGKWYHVWKTPFLKFN
jgi:hypothetical protein